MQKHSVSIMQKRDGTFSVDIRPLDKDGLVSPGGSCKLFRWAGDAMIWIKEQTGRDIPAAWPNIEAHNFAAGDYQQRI